MEQGALISGSRKLVGVIAALLLVLGLLLIAQGFIDTRNYRDQIIEAVKAKTGKEIFIKGKVTARLLPAPALYIPGLELRGVDPKDASPTLAIEAVYINPDVLSLFSDKLKISSVTLENPSMEIRRTEDGIIHWDWLGNEMFSALSAQHAKTEPVNVNIINGKFLFANEKTGRNVAIRSINADGVIGDRPNARGNFLLGDQVLSFSANTQGDRPTFAEDALPLFLEVATGKDNFIRLNGGVAKVDEELSIQGDFSASASDIMAWVAGKADTQTEPASIKENDAFRISGTWTQKCWDARLEKIQMEGLSSKGSGTMVLSWQEKPGINIDMAFSDLYYAPWRELALAVATRAMGADPTAYQDATEQSEDLLPKDIKVVLRATAEKLHVSEQVWQDAKLSATLQDAVITINEMFINLPDAATLTMFGIVSQGTSKNLRFEGNMESQGKSLRNLLTIFDASAVELPQTGFGSFYINSNIFISPEQLRLSEADVKLNDLQLGGGMVAYFDGKPRIEADVRLRDIDFDYFRDLWRESQKQAEKKDYFLKFNQGMNFNWLRKLKTNIDFKIIVDKFTFLEKKGETAAFRLFAQESELGLYNMRFYYPDHIVEASFNLNVEGETPLVTLLFNSSEEIDTAYFRSAENERMKNSADDASSLQSDEGQMPADASPRASELWSTELIDMSWMEGYNASLDISLGKLIHHGHIFDRVKLKAQLRSNLMTIQTLGFGYWQGRFDVTGTLYGGRVPGVSAGFTLTNGNLSEVIQSFSDRDNISGRLGASGTLSASGVNMLSWASQADAKLVLNGVGVNVDNFNLQGVVDVVNVSRTTADVVNNVNLVLPKGNTIFSLEGYLNVKNGIVRTPGITLKSGSITGNLTGDIKLIPWTMNLSTLFQFPAMTSETIPTMNVQLTGSVDRPDMRADTDSLEAYVSKRIVGR